MAFTKGLVRHGNSLALIIDTPIRKLLGIEEGDLLELRVEGKTLTIKQVEDGDVAFEAALEKANRRYGRMLERLAD